jgi:hypothetical protein
MSDERVWLVTRESFGDESVVTLVYATPSGDRHLKRQLHTNMLYEKTITAAETVEEERLEPVDDPEERERYATEVERMRERHDPEEEV